MEGSFSPSPVALELTEAIRKEDPDGSKIANAIRESMDYAYNGQQTGRFRPEELSKTESAHIGSLVEINIRRALDGFIKDGQVMDFEILGHEVDCKYSKHPFGWMIPNEALGHTAMVCHANDHESSWRLGFVSITNEILNKGGNRDQKRTISAQGRNAISWAWYNAALPPNTLLHLPKEDVEAIMAPKSGQKRIDELFRRAQKMRIPRGVLATVGQQKDFMKRARKNGGSRTNLAAEGILVLGQYEKDQEIAARLEIPVPLRGESVSVRVVRCEEGFLGPKVDLLGSSWRVATQDDPIEPAPEI
ncbi:NaeI family type II restriction endonuclease [Corynebacterium vitaeruminis]|uniref:Type II site-specific deoxyribonuclease n=1 Tax=Corynebacterium vitaeruminis DSM 20294 TaxID=1224164 RepID=W5Y0V1_9CORY|nr:NaeI family type II restriction endonuclease [Corynebacterium vitaeruminis]AHI22505.1 type II site-specific deoxyribonuclease [Corynebacterium vitaeruminis DSM 20294]